MAIKARGNTVVMYDGTNITQYCDNAQLQNTLEEIETTNLASTGKERLSGDPEWQIDLGGNWRKLLDDKFGPDSITPTKRTASIAFTDGINTVTYTWTTNAEIAGYTIQSQPGQTIKWTGMLRLSGAPNRTVS